MHNQTVVITGASAGVGRAAARAFAERGARIGLLARGADGLEATRKEVEAAGGQAVAISTDVADPEQVEAAAEQVEAELGLVDVWVNNAMTSVFAPLHEVSAEEFKRVNEVCYLGAVYGTMAALRRMRPRDRGVIVQVGSALAYRGIPLQSAYCGSQHGLRGFTESLRCELLHDDSGVAVSIVQLPALNTPQFGWVRARLPNHPQPVPPIYAPEVAADAIVWAAQHAPRELQVGASTVGTIAATKVIPGLLDHYLARTNYDDQQTDIPIDPDRTDNLFSPVPGDHGPYGIFGDKAKPRSAQLWLRQRRPAVAALAAAGALGVLGAVSRK